MKDNRRKTVGESGGGEGVVRKDLTDPIGEKGGLWFFYRLLRPITPGKLNCG